MANSATATSAPEITGNVNSRTAPSAPEAITPVPNENHEAALSAPEAVINEKATDAHNNEAPPAYPATKEPAPAVLPAANQTTTGQVQSNAPGTAVAMVTPFDRLGETPAWIDCPYCQKRTQTRVNQHDSQATGMAALACCLLCGIIGVCIPSLMGMCADTDHYCTTCNRMVATKPHDGPSHAVLPMAHAQVASNFQTTQPQPQPQPKAASGAVDFPAQRTSPPQAASTVP